MGWRYGALHYGFARERIDWRERDPQDLQARLGRIGRDDFIHLRDCLPVGADYWVKLAEAEYRTYLAELDEAARLPARRMVFKRGGNRKPRDLVLARCHTEYRYARDHAFDTTLARSKA